MRAARVVPIVCGAVALIAYIWLAAPGVSWLDAGELGAASVRMGVAHPTGFPLFCLFGRVLAWLPVGELAWRIHLGSALAAALAVGLTARLTILLTAEDWTGAIAAATSALVLGVSLTFFRQATVTEVYASLAAALAVSLFGLIQILRGAGPAVALAHAFFAGVAALGLHTSYRLLLFLPFVVILGLRLRARARWPLAAPLVAFLGAAAITLYLPVRSASGHVAALDWGHPRTAAALVDHLSASRIRHGHFSEALLSTEPDVFLRYLGRAVEQAEEDLGVLLLVAAAGGVVTLARKRRGRGPLALVAAVLVGDLAFAVWLHPMGIADRQTGVPLALALALLAGAGLAAAARVLGRFAPAGAAVLAVLVAVQPLLAGGEAKLAARSSEAPRAWAEAALDAVPPDGVALLRSDSLAASFFWLTQAEPVRPDVAALVRQHLWDEPRNRAVAGDPVARAARPQAWEIADTTEPREGPYQPSVPMALFGAAAARYRTPAVDLARIFTPGTLGDPTTRGVARRAYHNAAVFASRAGDPRRAAELEERALRVEDDGLYRVAAARYRLAAGDDPLALGHLDRAPATAPALALRGVIAARAGRCAEAAKLLDRALALDPGEPDAKENRAKLGNCR